MITKYIEYFCKDFTKIENYQEAVNDSTQIWHVHHRLEEKGFSRQYLIDNDMYFCRPPEELIFLTQSNHSRLHGLGKKLSEEHKAKIGASSRGRHFNLSEATKAKISAAGRGRKVSEATKEKLRIASTGRQHTEDTKKILSDKAKNRTAEQKERIRVSHVGLKRTAEQKERMSIAHKGKHRVYDNPEHTKWHWSKNE